MDLHNVEYGITNHSSKHSILPRKFRRNAQRNEELTPIIILNPSVRHTQQPATIILQPRMKLILKSSSILQGALTAKAGAGGVAALYDETWNYAVEYGAIVIAVQAVLEEVSGCEGGLLGEEFEEDITCCCLEEDFGGWLRFEVVEVTHDCGIGVIMRVCGGVEEALEDGGVDVPKKG